MQSKEDRRLKSHTIGPVGGGHIKWLINRGPLSRRCVGD